MQWAVNFVTGAAGVILWMAGYLLLFAFPFAFCAAWIAAMRRLAPEHDPDFAKVFAVGWVVSIGLAILIDRTMMGPVSTLLD